MHKRKYIPFRLGCCLLLTNTASVLILDEFYLTRPSLLIAQYRNKNKDWCRSEKAMGKKAWTEVGAGSLLH